MLNQYYFMQQPTKPNQTPALQPNILPQTPNIQPQTNIKQNKQKQNPISNYFSFADVFSVSPSFSHQKSQSFSTILSGMFGFIGIIISLYFALTNKSYFLTNVNSIDSAQEISGFNYSLNVQSYPVAFDFYLLNDTTHQFYRQKMYKNFTANFVCRSQTYQGIHTDISYGYDQNCSNGQYCMPSNFTCDIYNLLTGEKRYMVLQIFVCDPSIDPQCDYSGYVSLLYPYIRISYPNYIPSQQNPKFNIYNSFDLILLWTDFTYFANFTIFKQSFKTSNLVLGMLGYLTTQVYGINRELLDYQLSASHSLGPPMTNISIAEIGFVPSNQIRVMIQNFIDITGILGYYCSILGVITFGLGILMNHYAGNILKLNIGRYLNYSVDSNRKIIQFRQSNFKSILAALIYYQSLKRFYPNCLKEYLKYHFELIDYVSNRLTIDSLLADIKQINKVDNIKVPIIKPVLQQVQEYQQQQQEEKMDELKIEQLKEYLEANFNLKLVSFRQIQIFMKWIQVNNYDTNQAKSSADNIFNRNTFNYPVYVNNLINDYENFKKLLIYHSKKDDDIVCDNNVQMYKEKIGMDSEIKLQMTSSLKNKQQQLNFMKAKQYKNNLDIINREEKLQEKWDETY